MFEQVEESLSLMIGWVEDITRQVMKKEIEIEEAENVATKLKAVMDLLLAAGCSLRKCCGEELLRKATITDLQKRSIKTNIAQRFCKFLVRKYKKNGEWKSFEEGKAFNTFISKDVHLKKLLTQIVACEENVEGGENK